mgnify:CR=1 FL=1
MPILEKIYIHAIENPNKCAIIYKDQSYSYKNLALDIQSTSQVLIKKGVKKNNKIILRASNTYQFICVYFSIHMLGGVVILIPSEKDESFEKMVTSATSPQLNIENADFFFQKHNSEQHVLKNYFKIDANKTADIIYSSGTTGQPKGAAITHHKQCLATQHIIEHVKNDNHDTELILMPLSHSFGLGRLRSVLYSGGSLIIGPAVFNLKEIFSYMKKYNVNGLGLVPSAWNILRKLSKDSFIKFADQIKYIEFGSAYLSITEKKYIKKTFLNANVVMHYGLTEVSRATFINFKSDDIEAVGKIDKNVGVIILDKDGKVVENNEIGEILLKSSWMIDEYYDNYLLNTNAFHDGYIKTGDLGKVSNGYLYLTGRLKEIINIGGRKVSPNYIESKLNSISIVDESVCFGIPHKEMGECVVAFLVIKDILNIKNKDIIKEVNSSAIKIMPAYMVPEKIILIDEIPKTVSGKIKRHKLVSSILDHA